jgi:hypothetical protein
LSASLQRVMWILVASLITDGISLIFIQFSFNTHLLGSIYFFIQFSVLIKIFNDQLKITRIVAGTYFFYVLFFVGNILFFQGPWAFNSYTQVAASLILMALSLYYFYGLLVDLPKLRVYKLPMFWIALTVLIYYGGNFLLFLWISYLMDNDIVHQQTLWRLHNLLNITKNVLFAVAIVQGSIVQGCRNVKISEPLNL